MVPTFVLLPITDPLTCVGQVWQELPHRNGKARLIEYQKRSLHARCILSPKSPIICLSYKPDYYVTVTVVVTPTLYLSTEKEGERQRGNGKGTKAPFITLTAYAWDSVLPGKG